MVMPSGWLSDRLINSNYLSKSQARKVFQLVGVWLPAGCLVWVTYAGCDTVMVVTAICMAIAMHSVSYAGIWVKNKIPKLFLTRIFS